MSTSFGETKRDKQMDELYAKEDALVNAIAKLESEQSLSKIQQIELDVLKKSLDTTRLEMEEVMEVEDDSDDYYEAMQDDKSNLN
jgi:uncharacterized membrane protein